MSEVTRILSAIEQGDPRAAEQLLPLVYDELRRLAAQKLARETPGQTLQATALVHEAYLRLVGRSAGGNGAGVEQPRALLRRGRRSDAADTRGPGRHKQTAKAGGDRRRIEMSDIEPAVPEPDVDLLALHDALDRLEAADKRKADLVKLRFFVGLTIEEAAQALGVSISTATTDWAYARCWLRLEVLGVGDLKAT